MGGGGLVQRGLGRSPIWQYFGFKAGGKSEPIFGQDNIVVFNFGYYPGSSVRS